MVVDDEAGYRFQRQELDQRVEGPVGRYCCAVAFLEGVVPHVRRFGDVCADGKSVAACVQRKTPLPYRGGPQEVLSVARLRATFHIGWGPETTGFGSLAGGDWVLATVWQRRQIPIWCPQCNTES